MSTVGQAKVVFEAETGQVSDQLVAAMEKAMAKIDKILARMSQATEAEGKKAGAGLADGLEDGAQRAEKAVDGIDGSGLSKVQEAAAKAGDAVATKINDGASKADAAMDKIDGGGLSKVGEAAAKAGQKIDAEVTAGARAADAALDAIDGAGLGKVTTAAEKASTATEKVGSEAIEAGQKARAAGEAGASGFRTMDGTLGSVLSKAGRIGGAFAAVAGPAAVLKGGFDRLMNIQRAEIMFQSIGLSADQTKDQMARLSEQVTGTAVSLADAAKYSAMFAQSGVELGAPMDNAIQAFTSLSSIAEGSGVDVGRVLQQISANGKLTGEDLAQMADAGVNASKYLADYLGLPQEEIKKLVSDGKVSFEDFVGAVNQGTGDLAKQMGQTLPAKISNLKTALSNLGAAVIEPFIPGITAAVEFGIALVKGVVGPIKAVVSFFKSGNVIVQAFSIAIKALGVVILASAAGWALWAAQFVLWPAIQAAATAATVKFTGVMALLKGGLVALRSALMSLWTAFLANPIAWVIVGIAALVAAFVVLWKRSEAFRDFWTDMWNKIADPVRQAIDAVKAAWDGLTGIFRGEATDEGSSALARLIGVDKADWIISTITTVKQVWADLKTAFGGGEVEGGGALARLVGIDTAERVMEIIGSIKIAWGELWDAFQGGDSGYGALSTLLGDEGRAEFVVNLFARLGDAARFVWDTIKQVGQALADAGGAIAGAGWEVLQSVFSALADVGMALWDALVQIGSAVWDLVQALAPVLMPVLKVIGVIIGGVIVAAFFLLIGALKIVSGIFQVLGTVISWLAENVLSPLIGIIGEVVGWLVEKLGGAVAGLVDIVTGVVSGIGDVLGAIWEGLQTAWETVGQPVLDFIIGAFNFWWESLKLGFRLLQATFEVIWTALQMAWQAVGQPVLDWIVQKFNDMWTGVQIVLDWVRSKWDEIWNWIKGVYDSVIAPVVSWIVDKFNDLRVKVEVALYLVRGAIQQAADKVRALYDEYVQPMVDRVIRGFNRIKDTVLGWKDSLVDAVSDAGSWLVDAGRNVVQGFIDGIKSLAGTIGSAFLDMVPGWIKGPFMEALGIASPSKVFAEYGRNIGEGLVEGVESMHGAVAGATGELADAAAFPTLSAPGMPAAPAMPVAAPVPVVSGEGANLAADSSAQVTGAFASMAESMSGTATGVLDPMWAAQNAQFVGLGVTTQTQANSVIVPTWQAMAANMQTTQAGMIAPTLAAMNAAVMQTASVFYQQITAVITPALQYLVTVMFWVLNSGVNPVFAGIRGGLQTVVGAFTNAVAAITTQWAQVGEATARPVRFTIQSVFNDGLVGMWNSVSDLLGTRKMGTYPVRFARGGILPGYTPGRDPYTFVEPNTGMSIGLSGGEAIMRPEVARAMGGNWVDGVNAAARMGGPSGVKRYLGGFAGGGVVESITGLVRRFWPMMTITSTYRNTRDHHGGGRAVDFSNGRDSTPAMRSATSWFAKNYQPALLELIHSPSPFNIKNGRNVGNGVGLYGAGTMAQHRNHVHVAASRPLPAPGGALASVSGDVGGGDFDIAGSFTQEWKDKISAAVKGYRKSGGMIDSWPPQVADKLTKAADEKIEKAFMEFSGDPGGGNVERWAPLVSSLLKLYGHPASWLSNTLRRMNQESGGNPRAINLWDSNAAKGIPSKGLMQVIDPTFAANRDPRFPNDIWDPRANIAASMRYTMRTYGSLPNGYDRAGGYAHGGLMGEGQGMFHKTAFGPERVLSPRQTESFERLVDWIDRQPSLPIQPTASRGTAEDYGRATKTVLVTQNIIADDPKGAADAVEDRLMGLLT